MSRTLTKRNRDTDVAGQPGARWLVEQVDSVRRAVNGAIDPVTRAKYAQFMTPPGVARLMASLFGARRPKLRLLDAGAGIGSLTAAFVAAMLGRTEPPQEISVVAYEIDPFLAGHLKSTFALCERACATLGVRFTGAVRQEDFIAACAGQSGGGLFGQEQELFDCAIMNPPYKKIHSGSEARQCLRELGMETSNLYAGFMALAARQLRKGGEFVSISPRSFCNGPYFRPFRRYFLKTLALRQIHVFESRNEAFGDDDVLQENVIVHAVKSTRKPARVDLSVSASADEKPRVRHVPHDQVVNPDDPNAFIHLVVDEHGAKAREHVSQLPASLGDLGLGVSTGRVVDFRARDHLRPQPEPGAVPLIYPAHFSEGFVKWPNPSTRKPNAIMANEQTAGLLVPPGVYVVVKRFSAKEERRRIVAALYDAAMISGGCVGFENHLNYFHRQGQGFPRDLAWGLCLFLNSTVADTYFRQFSGHTQVNALDLRTFQYPSLEQLRALAGKGPPDTSDQEAIDAAVEEILFQPA